MGSPRAKLRVQLPHASREEGTAAALHMAKQGGYTELHKLQEQVDGVKSVMQDSIQIQLEKNAKLEHLEARANEGSAYAGAFAKDARGVKLQAQCREYKWQAILVGSVLLLVGLVVWWIFSS